MADPRELIAKLLALAEPGRGGTDAERAVALEKARRLAKRHAIPFEAAQRRARAREEPSRGPRRTAWAAPRRGPAVPFDWEAFLASGKSNSPGVKVHHFENRRSWKIEIDPNSDAPLFPRIGGDDRRRLR